MRYRKKIFGFFFITLFMSYGFFMPVFLLNYLSVANSDLSSYQLKLDKSLFGTKANRVFINFKLGVNLQQAKQLVYEICDDIHDPAEFDFISAMSGEISEEYLYKIAKLDVVQKIYLDEQIKLDTQSSDNVSSNDIFQLNQCATQIKARDVPYTGQGIDIAIIDTGIDFTHADLTGKKVAEVSFVKTEYGFDSDEEEDEKDYDGHGTHCAGIATGTGSQSPSGYNITGIAPKANLLNAKCLNQFGAGYVSSVVAAIEWSIQQNADIISMSLGFGAPDPDHPVSRAVDNATQEGIVVVTAAGNSGPFYSTVGTPAAARSVITVGANDKDRKITSFSSRGPTQLGYIDPDVVAPGENVLSAIAESSLLEKLAELEGDLIEGASEDSYAVLSGTSMSCPIVAGAAALLLEAFPNLNPYMVRIALMKGADSLGYSPNIEGAGLVNVLDSYNTLLSASPDYHISTVLPKQLPNPPFQFSLFPGEMYSDDLVILLSKNTSLSVGCTGNVSPYLSLRNTTTDAVFVNNSFLYIPEPNSQFTNLEVIFDVALNIAPSHYIGTIEIRNNVTKQLLETVNLAFNVRSPLGRVYFDCLHNSDFADHVRENYYNFTKLLYENTISVTFGSSLLSFPLLSQYDLLILPDLELPLTLRELAAIKQYWEAGGNLLLLGSSYPYTAIETLNALLDTLDVGINYTKTNIEWSYDMGILKFIGDFLITNITSHPITTGISQFSWLSGVALEVDPLKALSVASYSNSPVIGVYEQADHKLVCMGFERAFYDDFLSEFYNERLAIQTITWLLNDSRRSNSQALRVEVIVNSSILELDGTNKTAVGFYVSDPANGYVDNLVPHANLTCELAYYSSGWVPIWIGNTSDIVGFDNGAYYFNFSTNLKGLYRINVTIANLSSSRAGVGLAYLNATLNMPKILSLYVASTANNATGEYDETISYNMYRNMDDLTVTVTLEDADTLTDIQKVTCYMTSLDAYRSDIKYLSVEMDNTTSKAAVQTNFSFIFSPNYTHPAGSYTSFIEIIDSDGNADYSSTVFDFYLNDEYPVIDATQSTLKGKSFNDLQSQYGPTQLNLGSPFTVEITGSDTESALEDMYAYVLLFTYFIISPYAYLYEPIWAAELPYKGILFSDSLTLPSDGISRIIDDSIPLEGSYIMLIVLLDSDGQYEDDSYTSAMVNIKGPFNIWLIIIIVVVLLAAGGVILIWFKLKNEKIT